MSRSDFPRTKRIITGFVVLAACSYAAAANLHAQAMRAQPYNAQLRSDPAVGNVQGVQRFGRQLKTDPDQGEGYSYHVNPVTGFGGGWAGGGWIGGDPSFGSAPFFGGGPSLQSGVVPFDWTSGLRNFGPANAVPPLPGMAVAPYAGFVETQSGAVSRKGLASEIVQIHHQPLIQIKMRVVEVSRKDGIAVGSILEYVSRSDMQESLTSGLTANRVGDQGFENFRSIARLLNDDIVEQITEDGIGGLLNLTSEHINLLVQGLATELSADVITAPEVVTLNGQNVEFVSGQKLPFELGQNVIQGSNNNIQQVFYKHVGTLVSVTPRIVSWGLHGEGQGEASIQASEIRSWPDLIDKMLAHEIRYRPKTTRVLTLDPEKGPIPDPELHDDTIDTLQRYQGEQFIPFSAQEKILQALNNYSRRDLQLILELVEEEIVDEECGNLCRSWKADDCTIDLAVVVRLSDGIPSATVDNPDESKLAESEGNIRALANVIQVQSGHGVVMAGLIGEREVDDAAKVPFLGDLPFVGFMFRNKVVNREKTEVLIFIEAEVLDPDPDIARPDSYADFLLSQPYVQGELLQNPLEIGMHRVGFGTYLPPHTKHEKLFWEKYDRRIRKIRTHIADTLEP